MSVATGVLSVDGDDAIRKSVLGKLRWRIVFYVFFLFIINYLDRVNVGFAALHMNKDLGLSQTAYGLGAGIFFIGYILFEVPSNMIMRKVGPRIWIARIMVTWGLVSGGMAFVTGEYSYYFMRLLLGFAEAGFVPGVLLYLTYWFPQRDRAKATAGFMTATVLSSVIGAPISGWILSADLNWFGLVAWQWLFILEALPAVIVGVFTFFYLVDKPEQDRRWLTPDERKWLIAELDREHDEVKSVGSHDFRAIFSDYRVWLLTVIYMFNAMAVYGVVLWLPQIVKSIGGLSDFQTGLVTAVPFIFAAIGLIVVARSSDRTGERKWHTAFSAALGGGVPGGQRLCGQSDDRAGADLHCGVRRLGGARRVLEPADAVPHRGGSGRRPRLHQRLCTDRRFRRPLSRRLDQGYHPELHPRPADPGRRADHRRASLPGHQGVEAAAALTVKPAGPEDRGGQNRRGSQSRSWI